MKISAIIVTYNKPDTLEVILASILNQKLIPDEVIIANDGSGQETADLISRFKKNFPVKLKHVWQEDKGFRAATIRNKAINESTGDCLIFSDGDLIFHPCFFYDFKKNLQEGVALIGSRVFLNNNYSEKILTNKKNQGRISFLSSGIEKNRLNSIRLPMFSKLFRQKDFSRKLRGGLLAVWKQDIIKINGWNEDFTGWGMEDTELLARLFHSGIKFRKMKVAGITYHLWHPILNRSKVKINDAMLTDCINKRLDWCNNGLVKGEKF
ncbi:MAG: glycosyltransferase family 2 protein [Bacteroidota bacterium]